MNFNSILLTLLILLIFSCNKHQNNNNILKFTIKEIDSLFNNNILTIKDYNSKSVCGGSLDGYYFKNQLVLLEAKYSAELGYSYKKMYLKGNKFSKIIYREYFAEWEKHNKNTPDSEMIYSDTLYTISPLKNKKFNIYSYNKHILQI
ncbi:MAG: hypothetical protein ACPGU6_04455 [Tenacibaculum sp.]